MVLNKIKIFPTIFFKKTKFKSQRYPMKSSYVSYSSYYWEYTFINKTKKSYDILTQSSEKVCNKPKQSTVELNRTIG